MELLKRQLELEHEGVRKGVEDYRQKVLVSDTTELPPGMELLKAGMIPMVAALTEFMAPSEVRGGRLHSAKKLLRMLDVSTEEIAYLTLRFCLTHSAEPNNNLLFLQTACVKLTETILDHHEYLKFKKENPGYLRKLEEHTSSNMKHKRTVVMLKKRQLGIGDTAMSDDEKVLVGLRLIEMCAKATGFVEKVTICRKGSKDTTLHMVMTEKTKLWLDKHHGKCELLNPFFMPMVMIPKKWTSATSGGYYSDTVTRRNKAVKTRNSTALDSLSRNDMSRVYAALNAIQETPWRINKRILHVLDEVWKSGGHLGGLPAAELENMPTKPWTNDLEFQDMKAETPEIIKEWKREAKEVYETRISASSKRVSLSMKLSLAHKFKDEPAIYFPHTLDWRGRVYPIPSWITPQADDVGKALLEFAEGKPLGERGEYWLAVHGANTYGNDKISFDDRVKWVRDNEAAILDSAENPVDGHRFWAEADSPYCFLAFCMEWAEMKKAVMPEAFVSHLSIALDGTCNGLQHFSGMLLDEVGGKYVNLLPAEKPEDIYSKVAGAVSAMVHKDADEGNAMAALWVGKIDRGIAKRPVMTKPYGAKKHGYKSQLMQELAKRGGNYLNTEDTFKPAVYLADKMNDGINQVVVAARDAMDFLQNVARVVSKREKPITWTTPVGFPAWQEYRNQDTYRVSTFWGEVRLTLGLHKDSVTFNKNKMANSISPNFVHSMDASMLMSTVLACQAQGVRSFAMIHDSYGTHACDTDILCRELREEFIAMYSRDVLADFLEEVKQQIPTELHDQLPSLPPKGNLNLEDVRSSRYFFA